MNSRGLSRSVVLWLSALLFSLLITGCASTTKMPDDSHRVSDGRVAVANGVEFALLPVAQVLRTVVITQRIDASYHGATPNNGATAKNAGSDHSFIVQIEAGADDMQMVGLTPLGVQIFALSQRGAELAVDVPPYVSLPFDPRYMLADMQLSHADVALINSRLTGAQLHATKDGRTRELVAADGRQLMRIDYRGDFCADGSEIHLVHVERNYEIRITTLSCERL